MGDDPTATARAERARRILHSLRTRGEATLAQLTKDAGVSRPTASLIVTELEAEGLIAQSSTSSGAGRPAARYSFADRHGVVVALDIQRDEVSLTVASVSGTVLHCSIEPLIQRARQDRLDELAGHIRRVLDDLRPAHGDAVCGFASTTGIVDGEGRILRSYSVPQWHDLPLAEELAAQIGCPFRVDNDINSAGYGEFATRALGGRLQIDDTMLHISIFAGFRTALVMGGEIHHGHHWHAGEINDSLDGDLRARLDADTSQEGWAMRAAKTIGTVSSLIDPAVVVVSATGAEEEMPTADVWAYANAMRLPTAPKLALEDGELGAAASSVGALSMALRDAEAHFLHARTRHPVAVSGLDAVLAEHQSFADLRRAEMHRHAVVVSEPLRVGVIGVGMRSQLVRHVERPGNGAVIVGACDPDPVAATRVERLLGKTPDECPVVVTVRELIERGIGAAFVTSPDNAHEVAAVELLEAGIPVYLEKPMATSIEGATRILQTAADNGTRLYVGHNMRHMSFVRQMRQLILDGAIGEVRSIWCRHFVGHGGDFYFKDWHADRRYANGLLLQNAAHDIDVMHWLAGSESAEVVGMGDLMVYGGPGPHTGQGSALMQDWFSLENWPPDEQTGLNPVVDVEDLSMLMLRMRSGVMAAYQQCHFSPDHWRNYTVIGARGRIENFGDGEGGVIRLWNRRHYYDADGDERFPITGDRNGHADADALTVAEFLRFVRTGAETATSPLGAWHAVAAGIQATESLRDCSRPRTIPALPQDLVAYFQGNQQR